MSVALAIVPSACRCNAPGRSMSRPVKSACSMLPFTEPRIVSGLLGHPRCTCCGSPPMKRSKSCLPNCAFRRRRRLPGLKLLKAVMSMSNSASISESGVLSTALGRCMLVESMLNGPFSSVISSPLLSRMAICRTFKYIFGCWNMILSMSIPTPVRSMWL